MVLEDSCSSLTDLWGAAWLHSGPHIKLLGEVVGEGGTDCSAINMQITLSSSLLYSIRTQGRSGNLELWVGGDNGMDED